MDSLIVAAARALAVGDPLGALKRVSLRDDAPALALRGIAMAQLGDFDRARVLLRRATRAFGPREAVAKARCVVAEAEIALAARDLRWSARTVARALATLDRHGDHGNASHARCLEIRRLVLLGQLARAEQGLLDIDRARLTPPLRVTHALIAAGIALRRVQAGTAGRAIAAAHAAARDAGIPALQAEVDKAEDGLRSPAARVIRRGAEETLRLEHVEALFATRTVIVDACRYVVRCGAVRIPLATRPVLFSLARTLAAHWPSGVSRDSLVRTAFGIASADESLRARLRVEIGRLRAMVTPLADVKATAEGFVLAAPADTGVCVLAPPVDHEHAAVLALLADGESWSSSALALAMGVSQRTMQRALESLAAAGSVQSFGYARARRWVATPVPGIATMLLLPAVTADG